MRYKNMSQICRIRDLNLRIFAALCKDTELLEKLSMGFPELFTDTKPEGEGPIPLSAVKEIVNGLPEDTTLDMVSSQFGLTAFSCAHPDTIVYSIGESIPMPIDITQEYASHEERILRTNGFPFDLHRITINGVEYYMGWINPDGVRADHEKDFYIYPCELVDENA